MTRYRYKPSEEEPWWNLPDDPPDRVVQRATRLSEFRRQLARGPSTMMSEKRLAYRRWCLENWISYLAGIMPEKPTRGRIHAAAGQDQAPERPSRTGESSIGD